MEEVSRTTADTSSLVTRPAAAPYVRPGVNHQGLSANPVRKSLESPLFELVRLGGHFGIIIIVRVD